jgi:hypothetical protein
MWREAVACGRIKASLQGERETITWQKTGVVARCFRCMLQNLGLQPAIAGSLPARAQTVHTHAGPLIPDGGRKAGDARAYQHVQTIPSIADSLTWVPRKANPQRLAP